MQQIKNFAVKIHNLSLSRYNKSILIDLNLFLPAGRLSAVIGPNGAGKSSLINLIMGQLVPDKGYIKLFDQPLSRVRSQVAYIPQQRTFDTNFPISVSEFIMTGLYSQIGLINRPQKEDKDKVDHYLKKLNLHTVANTSISRLSMGQLQRICLARVYAQEASLYFMDEPLSAIDAPTQREILQEFKCMTRAGKTFIIIHHDLSFVQEYFDWVVILNKHLIASGPTKEVFRKKYLEQAYDRELSLTQV